jgi:PAS domain S-box-containing protein
MPSREVNNTRESSPQSAELFHLIVENVKDYAIFMTDVEGRVVSWNPGVEKLLGYAESEIVGQSIAVIFTPEDVAAGMHLKEMELARERGRSENKRWHLRQDGSRFWANGMVMPLRNADGTLRGFAKVMRDDTPQKLLEEQLRDSEEFNRSILDASVDCIKVLDLGGKLISMNATGLCLMEIDDFSDFRERRWADFWKGEEQEKALAAVAAARRGEIGRFRGFAETAKGNRKFWDVIVSPILDEDGRPKRILSVSRDISERKLVEKNLSFLSEISRDLPLLTGSREIKRAMTRKIGEYLGVSNCVFAEVDTTANTAVIRDDWRKDDGAIDLVGRYELSEFVSDEFRRTLLTGKAVVVNDVAADARTAENAGKFEPLRIGAFVNTPFVSGGDLKFVLGVYRPQAYEWRADEIELLGEAMARVWTRIERSRAEEELRESEERYRTLFDSMDEGFCTIEVLFDADGKKALDYRFLEINPSFEKLTGIPAGEALQAKTVRQLVPNLEEKWFEIYGRIALTGEPERFVEGSDAMGRWYDVYAFRVGEPEKRRVALLFNDVTERKRAESERERFFRQLEAERARLNYLFEQAPAFVATLRGDDHVFELTNPAYLQLIGHRSIAGKPVREALPEVEGQGFFELLDDVYRTGEPFIGQGLPVELQREPGGEPEKRFVDFVYQPIFDADGTVSGIFAHGVDITDQVAARRQAESANRLKDEFLATLSHELRTPLNAVLGWSQILQRDGLDESQKRKAIATIEQSARAQSQLIDDLLDVSRIITGKLRLDVRAVDLGKVIAAAVEAARPGAEAKNIRLQILLDPQAEAISGDPNRLQQVVWNLLSNAVKFTPKGGRVQVRLERINSHVEIVVSDTGQGIEPEFLPHVFDRFSQSDGSMTRRHGGLGLGLAIVRQLVELHGGTVSATSSENGATFTVSLPLLPLRVEPQSDAPARVHPKAETGTRLDCSQDLDGLRILIVEDEADSRELLNLMFASCGAEVVVAASAAEALKTIGREKFDLLISDIGMPEEDGYSLIRKIRKLTDEEGGAVPAIALTAYARAEDRVKALQSGFQMHVAKPVEAAELIATAANLAGRMRNPKENES